jgi:TonB family protein
LVLTFREILAKWINGSFRASDGRAMQEMTQQDADFREAMEGYTAFPEQDHAERLARMRKRLPQSEQPKPIFHTAFGKFSLAAASLALLFAAWWFLSPVKVEQPTLASAPSSTEISPTTEVQAPVGNADVVVAEPKEPESSLSKTAPVTKPTVAKPEPSKTLANADVKPNNDAAARSTATDAIVAAEVKEQPQTAAAEVAAAPAAPAPMAQLEKEEAKVYSAKTEKAKRKEPASAMASQSAPSFETDKKPTLPTDKEAALEPNGGWTRWDLYLMDALVYPKEAAERRIIGSVRLTFWIDDEGRPSQIRVARSLGYGCDEEALRLLMEGPVWSPRGSKNGAVEIKFPR